MRTKLLLLPLLFASAAVGQDCVVAFRFTNVGSFPVSNGITGYNNQTQGCTVWNLSYNSNGFSAVSLQVNSAPDAGNTPGTLVAFAGTIVPGVGTAVNPNTATTQAQTVFTGYFPWISVQLVSKTGSGSILGVLQGYKTPPVATTTVTGTQTVVGPAANGAAVSGAPVRIGGSDGTTTRDVSTDATGKLQIICSSGCSGAAAAPATYQATTGAAANGKAVVATATDFFCIVGSGTKTIFITSIDFSAQAGSSTLSSNLDVVVRSTLDSGGTSTNLTAVPLDSANAAATATITTYSANPAGLGTAVGQVKSNVFVVTGTATGMQGPMLLATWTFGSARGVQPLTLRGATQEACLNANGATTFTFGTVNVEWYEQ